MNGIPCNVDAERFVLGSILLDDSLYPQAAGMLSADAFSLQKHRTIFKRMGQLQDRGEKIDRITVANELMKFNELDSCDGLSYIVSLDDGLPQIPNLDSYILILKEKALLRGVIYTAQEMMNRAMLGEESAPEIISSVGAKILSLGGSEGGGGLQGLRESVAHHPGGLEAFLNPSKHQVGISTGFTTFDAMTGGLKPGELIVIAGRPSMGKSAICFNIAEHVAFKAEKPVAIFTLEMSRDSVYQRMLCSRARVDSQRYRAGYLSQEERRKLNNALHDLMEAPIYVDDSTDLNLMGIHSKVSRLKQEHGDVGLVIVDYLQLMSSPAGRQENRNQEVSALSRGMKLLGKELNVPMMVLSQLSRAVEQRAGDHRPILSDLRESGGIEQDADVVGFVFREEVYHRDREDLRGLAELIVAKQRTGPIGTVNLVYLHAQTKFENRAEDLGDVGEDEATRYPN